MREDLKAKHASAAKRLLIKEAEKGSVPAMRYLHELENKAAKGRPETKTTKTKEVSTVSSIMDAYKEAKK